MKNNKYYIMKLTMLLCLAFFSISCEDEISTVDTPDQLFRPVVFKSYIDGNRTTLNWLPIANASYYLEISRDSLIFEKDLQTFSLDDIDKYMIDDLWSVSRYSARIKAISKDGSVKDSEYNQITFITGTENTFYSLADDDIGFNSVKLRWFNKKNVDKIIVSTVGISDVTISLSPEDIIDGEKLIDNLSPGTDYEFKIYLGEMLRGKISTTTYTNFSTVLVDETQVGGTWEEIGTYYFNTDGAYVMIRNEGANGLIIADAFKFSKEGYNDIIIDNMDNTVGLVGVWNTSSSSPNRIGENYFYRTNHDTFASVKYIPNLPVSGQWRVYMIWNGNSGRASNVPVDIFAGN